MFLFPQGFYSSFTSNGTSMFFQSKANHILMESVFRSLLNGLWPKERVAVEDFKMSSNTFRHRKLPKKSSVHNSTYKN